MVGGPLLFFHNHLLFLRSFCPHVFLICPTLTEQYTKEQSQIVTVLEETSDLDTNVLQSTEEVFQSRDSISLSLVEETSQLIVYDFVPEEVTLNVIIEVDRKIEGKEEAKKFTAGKICLCFHKYLFYFFDLAFYTLTIILSHVEQHTKEEESTDFVAGEISNLGTKDLESAQEATQNKESLPLSLVDGVVEIVVQDCAPEEVILDVILDDEGEIDEKGDVKTSAANITTHG